MELLHRNLLKFFELRVLHCSVNASGDAPQKRLRVVEKRSREIHVLEVLERDLLRWQAVERVDRGAREGEENG